MRISPSSVQANEGDYVELNCEILTGERANVQWSRRDGEPLPRDAIVGADNSIIFPRIQNQDLGEYTCTVQISSGVSGQAVAQISSYGKKDQRSLEISEL